MSKIWGEGGRDGGLQASVTLVPAKVTQYLLSRRLSGLHRQSRYFEEE